MDLVMFMDRFWRNAGNAGFDASIDASSTAWRGVGFAARAAGPADGPSVWVEQSGQAPGWDYSVGTLALAADEREPEDGAALARAASRGALHQLVSDAGRRHRRADCRRRRRRAPADYEGKDVRAPSWSATPGPGRLWQMAVVQRGAIGVVSTAMEDYIRPGPPGSTRPRSRAASGTCCSGAASRTTRRDAGFGFKATPQAVAPHPRPPRAAAPRACGSRSRRLSRQAPVRSLVAEIPGAVKPEERVRAGGARPGTRRERQRQRMRDARRNWPGPSCRGSATRRSRPPGRTLTFLWGDEIRVEPAVDARIIRPRRSRCATCSRST